MNFISMAAYNSHGIENGIFFMLISVVSSSIVNYTVITSPTIYNEIVVNLTTTGEPIRAPSNDTKYDIIAEFLEKVEEYEQNKDSCIPGTHFNLGKGVIQQYGINRFKRQALVAVNRANFLTRIWKSAPKEVLDSEYLFYTQVRNLVEGDPDIFAGGNCHDYKQYKDYDMFCPYAYRTENGSINVKDLAIEYNYLGNDSEWFYEARKHAANVANFNFTIAMINAGIGEHQMNNILAFMNLPTVNKGTLKTREREIGQSIDTVAVQSCSRAVKEEILSSEEKDEKWVEVSADGGWQRRGTGHSNNSMSGHVTIVGKTSRKCLSFAVAKKNCRFCRIAKRRKVTVTKHKCRKNWSGSSKAIEPFLTLKCLQDLKGNGLDVNALTMDDDTSTFTRAKSCLFPSLRKNSDKNHVVKNMTNSLYNVKANNKKLSNETITYVKKRFSYAVSQNQGDPEGIKRNLNAIVPHSYGEHGGCDRKWCRADEANYRHSSLPGGRNLTDPAIRKDLEEVITPYISEKFTEKLASISTTNPNENLNMIISRKAPKGSHFSESDSLDIRVSAAIAQKNEGHAYILEVNDSHCLTPGHFTKKRCEILDKKRHYYATQKQTVKQKRRRIELKEERVRFETFAEVHEGKTYATAIDTADDITADDIAEIPPPLLVPENVNLKSVQQSGSLVVFDLETTGLGTTQWRYNGTHQSIPEMDSSITVTYDDGHWSIPYFDCGGGFIWMMTYTVPFFGNDNGTFKFKGTSGIDIDLQKVDIDQCPSEEGQELNVFANSARCKNATTKCVAISGLGFRRGSYKCVCKDGFYFPDIKAINKYYNGSEIEIRYREKIYGENDYYDRHFECLPCAEGCDTCLDASPCVLTLNWLQRSIVLAVSALIMCCIPALIWFTVQYRDVKVLKAASPVLLRIILLGAFLLYCPLIVSYFEASVVTCCLRFWFREIGFSISYGALLLKTWRISVVFRVRSAQRIKISDADLIKRLIVIVLIFAACSVARTVAGTPRVVQGKHVSGLKAFQCSSDWWDHSAAIAELLFLLWGIRLCIVVRKAPSEFNESRFISWAIYNETLLSLFLNVSMIFLQDPFPANPDLLYLVIFIHSNLTTTVTLAFLLGSKAYLVYKYRGKNNEVQHTTMVSKGGGSRHMYGNKQTTMNTDTLTSNANSFVDKYVDKSANEGESESLLEKDIQEEFRRLYTQLETLKHRNMKIGNRHLQHKLSAMTEAAQKEDSPEESKNCTPNMNGKRVIINLDDFKESTSL